MFRSRPKMLDFTVEKVNPTAAFSCPLLGMRRRVLRPSRRLRQASWRAPAPSRAPSQAMRAGAAALRFFRLASNSGRTGLSKVAARADRGCSIIFDERSCLRRVNYLPKRNWWPLSNEHLEIPAAQIAIPARCWRNGLSHRSSVPAKIGTRTY